MRMSLLLMVQEDLYMVVQPLIRGLLEGRSLLIHTVVMRHMEEELSLEKILQKLIVQRHT